MVCKYGTPVPPRKQKGHKSRSSKFKNKSGKFKGRCDKVKVLRGSLKQTTDGLKAKDLRVNKHGKIVRKSHLARGQKNPWTIAVKKVFKKLGITGFVPIRKGTLLYKIVDEFACYGESMRLKWLTLSEYLAIFAKDGVTETDNQKGQDREVQ